MSSNPFVEQRRHNRSLEDNSCVKGRLSTVLQRLCFKVLLRFEVLLLLQVFAATRGLVSCKQSGACMC